MRVDAIVSIAAVVWGTSRVSIVGSLVAIEHHLSSKYSTRCDGSLIQTVSAREVPYATFDSVEKPVIVVTDAVCLTWRSILTLLVHSTAMPIAHPAVLTHPKPRHRALPTSSSTQSGQVNRSLRPPGTWGSSSLTSTPTVESHVYPLRLFLPHVYPDH